jgi:DNA-binding IclR family transcriptional regulator
MSTVQSIDRAFAVLRSLTAGPAGVTQLAEQVDLPKSTVSRLLATLEELGVVEQIAAGGNYRIGSGLIEIASAVMPGRSLVAAARPHLVELARQTGEAAGLAVPEGRMAHYVDQADSDNQVQVRDWTGERIVMHAVPSGLVFLAWAEPAFVEAYLKGPLQAFTSRTITDPGSLRRRLAEIRETGYAWNYEEFADGANSVAAPIRNERGDVIAAIHSHGPAHRFPGTRAPDEIGGLVVAAARRLRAAVEHV